MEEFKLFNVFRMNVKTGKSSEAAQWWWEKGKAMYESFPGVKSVKAYAVQFSLGGNSVEVWLEMENYAAFDRIDEDLGTNPQKYTAWADAIELFDVGPARMMGDWPESQWTPSTE